MSKSDCQKASIATANRRHGEATPKTQLTMSPSLEMGLYAFIRFAD
jgi:hypothetical protein